MRTSKSPKLLGEEIEGEPSLDVGAMVRGELELARSESRWIRAGDLKFDRDIDKLSYQRSLNPKKINEMVDDWSSLGLGIVLGSERAVNDVWVMDGMHRVIAAIQKFGLDFMLKVEVYFGLTREQEARVFSLVNAKRGQVSPAKRYRAAYLGGDREVITMVEAMNDEGIVPGWETHSQDKTLTCFVSAHNILRNLGEKWFRMVLCLASECWGADKYSMQGYFLTGISLLIKYHKDDEYFDLGRIADALEKTTSLSIDKQAKDVRKIVMGGKMTPAHSIYWMIYKEVNKSKRKNRLGRCRVEGLG